VLFRSGFTHEVSKNAMGESNSAEHVQGKAVWG